MNELKDAVAVVTGASRGIGAGLVRSLTKAGLRVAACARTPLDQTEGLDPAPALYEQLDITDARAVADFADKVQAELGPIAIWVNNAGLLAPMGRAEELDAEAFARLMNVNVVGVHLGSAAFVRQVRASGHAGTLINIGSGAATSPYAGWSAYCASKAAVDQYSRVLAVENADAPLRVVSLAPGVIETGMQRDIRSQSERDFPEVARFVEMKDEGFLAEPESVGELVLALASQPEDLPGDGVCADARDLRDSGWIRKG